MKSNASMIVAALAALLLTVHASAEPSPWIELYPQQASERAWSAVAPERASDLCVVLAKDEVYRIGVDAVVQGRALPLRQAPEDHRCVRHDIHAGDVVVVRGPSKRPQVKLLRPPPK